MDDYVHCFMSFLTNLPNTALSSPLLPLAASHTLTALTCPASETTLICLDTLAHLAQQLSHPNTQSLIQPVFRQYGKAILSLTLSGVVQGFPEDGLDQVHQIVGATSLCAPPNDIEAWATEAMGEIPGYAVPLTDKQNFIRELHE